MVFNNNLLLGAAGASGDYTIDQSIRFNSADSATMSRSFGTPTDRNKWTYAFWIKSTKEQNGGNLGTNTSGGVTFAKMCFNGGAMQFFDYTSGSANIDVRTTFTSAVGKFRDYSGWYHAMFVYDSDQSTDSDRLKFYINGTQFPAADLVGPLGGSVVWPSSGYNSKFNASGTIHSISENVNGKIDGYMAEIYFIDGQALDPTSFGEFKSTTGQFVPIQYSGTFGNNGFYIDGADSTFLGKDAKATSAAVTNKASTSSEWGGETGAYTFATNEIDRSSTINAIISTDLLSGDFSFDFTMTATGGAVRVGVIDDQEFNTFNGTGADGGMDSMTNSWYLDKGNNQFRYGGASQGSASGVVNGAAVTIERTGSTIKITDDGSDAHTFSQTFSGPVRVVISGGGAAFNLDDVQYTADDASGNDNSFFSSGLAAADQVLDTPTANLPTFNSLSSGAGTLSDGNLQYVGTGSWTNTRLNLLLPETGKWAVRFKSTTSYQQIIVGACEPDSATTYGDLDVNGVVQIRYNTKDGNFVTRVGGSKIEDTGPPTVAAQTFFQLLFDMDNGKMGVAADGATSGTFADISTYPVMDLHGSSLSTARQIFAMVYSGTDSGAGAILDAGQSGWTPTVTGFSALTLANLPDPTIADPSAYFQTSLWNGNGSTQTITQSGNSTFEPGMIWSKARNAAQEHVIFDQVRGATKYLQPDNTGAEGTQSGVTAFNSDGFDLGSWAVSNGSGQTHVGWQWAADGTSGSSNTDGSITSTVSANTTSGFSIATYTGNGTSGATFGHGLGVAPKMVIVKERDPGGNNWMVGHDSVGWTKYLALDNSNLPITSSARWNDTAPSSTVVTLGDDGGINANTATYVAYCFAEVDGFSKTGSYVANASTDGPFVYCGFKPAFVIFMPIAGSGAGKWMLDTVRSSFNAADVILQANTSAAESSGTSYHLDFVSNGFKVRTSSDFNSSGRTIAFMAFAESPFKHATARGITT